MSPADEKPRDDAAPAPVGSTARALHEKRRLSPPASDEEVRHAMKRRSRRAFLVAGSALVGGSVGLRWLLQPERSGVFERMLGFNERLGRRLFDLGSSAPEFSRDQAKEPRVNGTEGLSEDFDPALWRLQVAGLAKPESFSQFAPELTFAGEVEEEIEHKFPAASVGGLSLALADIQALPRIEMTTELKCIEGWSTVVHWAGARFSDFVAAYFPTREAGSPALPPYVSLVTPDRGYYVGWDMPSILHSQTLLCYEMNGAPLSLPHGGPLRLVTTTKYGIKQIKRIGRITFTAQRPPDYWAEQGYDWYSGL